MFYSWKNPEKLKIHKTSSTTVFNSENNKHVSWAANQHIRMISKGSCDTEDWINFFNILK